MSDGYTRCGMCNSIIYEWMRKETKKVGGVLICGGCQGCSNGCGNKLHPDMFGVKGARDNYGNHKAKMCPACHARSLKHRKKCKPTRAAKGSRYKSILFESRADKPVLYYMRFEKPLSQGVQRVIEVAEFDGTSTPDGDLMRIVTQMGTSTKMVRPSTHVLKGNPKVGEFLVRHEMHKLSMRGRNVPHRYLDSLRRLGWRVTFYRNYGRESRVPQTWQMTWHEEEDKKLREEIDERLTEKLGNTFTEKIDKVDEKYSARVNSVDWVDEGVADPRMDKKRLAEVTQAAEILKRNKRARP